MFDWLGSGKKQNEQSDQKYFGAITALHQHVSTSIATVDGLANDLGFEYSAEALTIISARFESISKEYTDFTIVASHIFYEVLRRSSSRTNAAKRVAQQAKSIAKLFEKYAKKPKSYSAVNSRLEINKLTGELRNLSTFCTPEIRF